MFLRYTDSFKEFKVIVNGRTFLLEKVYCMVNFSRE